MKKRIISIALVLIVILGISSLPAFAAATLSLDKTNYAQGETITVSYSGITAEMKSAQAWIGIAKQGAAADGYITGNWDYVNEGSGSIQLTAPSENGTYEARFYQGYSADDANLVRSASVTFTVGAASQPAQQAPAVTQTSSSGIKVILDGRALTFDVLL